MTNIHLKNTQFPKNEYKVDNNRIPFITYKLDKDGKLILPSVGRRFGKWHQQSLLARV